MSTTALLGAVAGAAAVAILVPPHRGRSRLGPPAGRVAARSSGGPAGASAGGSVGRPPGGPTGSRWGWWRLPPARSPRDRRLHRIASWVVAVGAVLVLGIPVGPAFAAVALVVVPRFLARLEPAADRRRRERVVADLPLAVDLLAACLRAGRPPGDALAVVAAAVAGPLGDRLAEVGQRLRLGTDPVDAWRLLDQEAACAPIARAVRRALVSGAPLARTLEQLATDVRQEARWTADERARAVETRAVVPLGLCFLPAFVLIGIVPTIAGSFAGILDVLGG